MRMVDLIAAKKRGEELSAKEIAFMVDGYTKGKIPDYQMSAMCMAICFSGMTHRETADLTRFMAESGGQMDLSALGNLTVDKHSTGGVGDKTTLVAEPMAAACGLKVAKMSGRGLGFTGGTIDKLQSIPGLRTDLSMEEFFRNVEDVGIAIAGQTADLAPADKKIYALRDVTATVDSIPLIASSIMSKKLAAGAGIIELDVKCGSGAFMQDREQAKLLAETMVQIGNRNGRKTSAWITNMDQPLGLAIGNALEAEEAVETLRGGGPADLRELCICLCAGALSTAKNISLEDARQQASDVLDRGLALEKFRQMVSRQGGSLAWIDHPEHHPKAPFRLEAKAPRAGWLCHMDTAAVGVASMVTGAGRAAKDSVIDPLAGILLHKKTGAYLEAGETIAEVYASTEEAARDGAEHFLAALTWGDRAPEPIPLILGHITE